MSDTDTTAVGTHPTEPRAATAPRPEDGASTEPRPEQAAGTDARPERGTRTEAGVEDGAGTEPRAEQVAGRDGGSQRGTLAAPRAEQAAGTDARPQRGTPAAPRAEQVAGRDGGAQGGTAAGTGGKGLRAVEMPQGEDDPVVSGPQRPDRGVGGADEVRTFGRRMDRAVHDFVEDPRRAVREADAVLDEVMGRMERAVESRRQALREGSAAGADTEALRVALTRYRDLTGRLLTLAE